MWRTPWPCTQPRKGSADRARAQHLIDILGQLQRHAFAGAALMLLALARDRTSNTIEAIFRELFVGSASAGRTSNQMQLFDHDAETYGHASPKYTG